VGAAAQLPRVAPPERPLTVGAATAEAAARLRKAGSESARLDAELLLAFTLGIERTTVLAHPEARIGATQAGALEAAVERRASGEPIAYIRGHKEFHGLALTVDRRVLVPRPETELLVDLAMERVQTAVSREPGPPGAACRPTGAVPFRIWDVGTGSGAIAVALADALRGRSADEVRILATDVSAGALAVAAGNVAWHRLEDVVELRLADLAAERGGLGDEAPVDLLLANLPYIPSEEVPGLPIAAIFEPRLALDGGGDGLELVRRLLSLLPEVLAPRGLALLEIGAAQAEAAMAAAATLLCGCSVAVHPDLAGDPRVLEVRPVPRA